MTHRFSIIALFPTAVAATAVLIVAPVFAGTRYSVTELGTLFGGPSFVWAVNSAGQAVGQSAPSATPLISQSFVWENGVMTQLPGFGGAAESLARDINEQGDICGASATTMLFPGIGQPVGRAYLRVDGVTTQLPSLHPQGGSYAMALNESRQVVGWSHTSPPNLGYHAFLWEDSVMTDLGSFDGDSLAFDINEAGDIVGHADVGPAPHAVLWSDGRLIDLAPFGAFHSQATAVNDRLQIVGSHRPSFSVPFRAFLWDQGKATDLGTLGGTWAEANAINNSGQIVGASGTPDGFSAFLWEDGVMTDLRDLAPGLPARANASGISDDGRIVAYALISGGVIDMFLLTPQAPDPADLNGDGVVNTLDLGILLSSWSIPPSSPGCGGAAPCLADLDHNGFVNSLDLGILLSHWG